MVRNIEVQNTFSGPLDLLLYLVRRDEIDIHDIPVGHVTKEYLNELNKMQEIDVDAGGEFLAMASMLTEIKGRMLLPDVKDEDDDEDEIFDPRQGLVEALLEYKKFKEVAAELEAMSDEFGVRYSRSVKEPEFQAVVKEKAEELGALNLLAAFQRIARRMLNERAPREIVSEEVPTEIRIQQIEEVVCLRGRVSFSSILSDSPSEDEMVGFFIAMLELIRMRKIEAQQAIDFSEIYFIPITENKTREQELEEELPISNLLQTENSVNYIRVSKLGLSNTFGIKQIEKISVKANKYITANRFDVLSSCRKPKSDLKKIAANYPGSGFPPLLKNSISAKQAHIEAEKRDEVFNQIADLECVLAKNIEAIINRSNSSFRLSSPFILKKPMSIINKKKALELISNNFDMLRIKPTRAISKYIKIKNSLTFMPLISGKLFKHAIEPVVSCKVLGDAKDTLGIISNNSSEIKEEIQVVYCRSKGISTLFGMKHTFKFSAETNCLSRKANVFDTLNLKRLKELTSNKSTKYNSLKFMRFSTGKICPHVISNVDSTDVQTEIAVNPVFAVLDASVFAGVKAQRKHTKLSTPFMKLVKRRSSGDDLKHARSSMTSNKFDIFKFKSAVTNIKDSLSEGKLYGFMRVGSGKVIPHKTDRVLISSGKMSCNAITKNTVELRDNLYKSNKVKCMSLSSPFSMIHSYQLGIDGVTGNKFEMLLLRHNTTDNKMDSKKALSFLSLYKRGEGKYVLHDYSDIYTEYAEINLVENAQVELTSTSRLSFKLSNVFSIEISRSNYSEIVEKSFDFMNLASSKVNGKNTRVASKSFLKL